MNRRGDCICAIPAKPPEQHHPACPVRMRALLGEERPLSEQEWLIRAMRSAAYAERDAVVSYILWMAGRITIEARDFLQSVAEDIGDGKHVAMAVSSEALRRAFDYPGPGSGAVQAPVEAPDTCPDVTAGRALNALDENGEKR